MRKTTFSKVLIIDDNEMDLMVARAVIKRCTAESLIITELSALHALSILADQSQGAIHPDLILVDIDMPVMDGLTFVNEISKLPDELTSNVAVYFLSSNTDPQCRELAVSLPLVKGMIAKPFTDGLYKDIIMHHENEKRVYLRR